MTHYKIEVRRCRSMLFKYLAHVYTSPNGNDSWEWETARAGRSINGAITRAQRVVKDLKWWEEWRKPVATVYPDPDRL